MAIVLGGRSPSAARWIDEAGVEHVVVQIRWVDPGGVDHLVWDGSIPALVNMPRASASASARPVTLTAGQSLSLPTAVTFAEVRPITVTASGRVLAPAATAAAEGLVSEIAGGASVEMGVAQSYALVLPMSAGESAPGDVYAEVATSTAQAFAPSIEVPATVSMPVASAQAEAKLAVIRGTGAVLAPVASATAAGVAPTHTAGHSLALPAATASAAGRIPAMTVAATVSMPCATATALAPVPTVTVFAPSGMVKSGTQSTPNSSTRSQITGWVADSAYPGSTVSGDGLSVTGTRLVTVAAQITYTEAGQSFTANVLEIRNQSGTVLATGGATGSNRIQTVSASNVSVSAGDVLSLWASRGRSSTVDAAGTYLNFTW